MTSNPNLFTPPQQIIHLNEFKEQGLILDIGGGSEGLVSRIAGARVTALDISMLKLREAMLYDPGSQWVLGDARKTCFNDSVFDIITIWFTLGYLRDSETKQAVLGEVFRLLKKGGMLSIYGCVIETQSDSFLFPVIIHLPDGSQVQTGYRVSGNQNQTSYTIMQLLKEIGFRVSNIELHEYWFKIDAHA